MKSKFSIILYIEKYDCLNQEYRNIENTDFPYKEHHEIAVGRLNMGYQSKSAAVLHCIWLYYIN